LSQWSIGIGNNWVEGNDCFINKPEILNKSPFMWSFSDSKNRKIEGAGELISSPCFFKEFMIGKRPHHSSGFREYCF
jgi:hypothetical protein